VSKDSEKIKIDSLIRRQIIELMRKLETREEYVKVLENKIITLEQQIYDMNKEKKSEDLEKRLEEEMIAHNVEEGLKKMGIDAEHLEELGDLLDEVLGKEDKDER
tara:strand:+ start:296 stop:610 length:315 start_codon:yes stop_codon:yes gene_type:complete